MPGRGRPATPTAIKLLKGNPGKRPLNDAEPQFPAADDLGAPEWLDTYGRELWEYLAPILQKHGVLTVADTPMLAIACERWSVYRRAAKRTQRSLTQISKANGRSQMPELGIAKGALTDLLGVLREFGVGPSSRTKVNSIGGHLGFDKFGNGGDADEEFFGS